jgi:long-chain acyl-CoA synthetase
MDLRSDMPAAMAPAIVAEPVFAALDRAVRDYPSRTAIYFMGRRWSYRQLGRLVERAAKGLQDIGVGKGVRFGVCLPNTPYFVVLYYAALKCGATVVNFNPLYVERELKQQVLDSGTTVMATLDVVEIYPKIAAIAEEAGLSKVIVCSLADALPRAKGLAYRLFKRSSQARPPRDGRHLAYERLIASSGAAAPVEIDAANDLAVLQYTGGTTGLPKAAELTHANLSANCQQVAWHMSPNAQPGHERAMAVLPLFHAFALTTILNLGVEVGAELILEPRFDLKRVIRLIERLRPTMFPAVPTIYNAIGIAAERAGADLRSIRTCISGGAPLPQAVRAKFEALTGAHLVEGYGLSEASPVVTCNPLKGVVKDGSVGPPMIGTTIEIRDIEDSARILPAGAHGEVCIRGPQVMRGYWRRPEETAAAFVDGALRTGDVGYLDEDGYLFLVDRLKDVIICGGYNVFPRTIEEALYRHPAVAEAVVIGVPDAYRGEAPKGFVTLKPGAEATRDEIRRFLTDQISKIEMPREIEIRDELPKTLIGKLSKKELVAEKRARAAQAAAS